MSVEAWAIVVTIGLAAVGYWVSYQQQRAHANRQAQLERVNLQLRNLYGPLYSTLKANEAIWASFTTHLWPEHGKQTYFGEDDDSTTAEERERWRTWMMEVFEPLNARIERVITENGDLLEGSEFPDSFVQALAHISAYRAVYPRWQAGDFTVHTSLLNFPASLYKEVESVYLNLLRKQKQLSGQLT